MMKWSEVNTTETSSQGRRGSKAAKFSFSKDAQTVAEFLGFFH